jgi:hypothetical protein
MKGDNNKAFYFFMKKGCELTHTCLFDGDIIEETIKESRRFSYKKALKIIKTHCGEAYEKLALEFHNPWSNHTYISRDGRYLNIEHSMINYMFTLNK